MSSHNPFRDPARLRPSSSSSSISSTTLPPSLPPKSQPNNPHPEPSSPAAASTSSPTSRSAVNPNNSSVSLPSQPSEELRPDPTGLTEDLPPAYTPGPNVYQGESTVEFGPARPFQRPPRSQPSPQLQPQPVLLQPTPTGWSTSSSISQNHYTGRPPSLLQQLTGQIVSQLTGASSNGSYSRYQSPSWSGYPGQQTHNTTPSLLPRPSSAAGRFAPPPGPPPHDAPPLPARRNPISAGGHEPPQGPPPSSGPSSPHSGPPPAPSQARNDGRPTTTPVPGHPLLNNHRLLVYPTGFECDKCRNTGYKQNDPSHPCRKCWAKYSKPFTGALTYTDFSPESRATGNFQRPLPSYHSPQSSSNFRPAPPNLGYQPSYITPHRGFLPPPRPMVTQLNGFNQAPRGSVVYPTGDPRIGGRLCWRCEGSGLISFLFLEDNCPVCGGIGRTFN